MWTRSLGVNTGAPARAESVKQPWDVAKAGRAEAVVDDGKVGAFCGVLGDLQRRERGERDAGPTVDGRNWFSFGKRWRTLGGSEPSGWVSCFLSGAFPSARWGLDRVGCCYPEPRPCLERSHNGEHESPGHPLKWGLNFTFDTPPAVVLP